MKNILSILLILFSSAVLPIEKINPILFVNFVVLTDNYAKAKEDIINDIDNEVSILNKNFVNANREQIIEFKKKNLVLYDDIKNSSCDFVRIGEYEGEYNSDDWQELFNDCKDTKVADKRAVNFYIYDGFSKKDGFSNKDSHGKNNRNYPYILLDWQRLNHNVQSPEEHEMGHALGLKHVCVPGAKNNSNTNIMASSDCGRGSGGLRNIGFDEAQVNIILDNVKKINDK